MEDLDPTTSVLYEPVPMDPRSRVPVDPVSWAPLCWWEPKSSGPAPGPGSYPLRGWPDRYSTRRPAAPSPPSRPCPKQIKTWDKGRTKSINAIKIQPKCYSARKIYNLLAITVTDVRTTKSTNSGQFQDQLAYNIGWFWADWRHRAISSVAEPKLFIFGSGSDFDHNFGSGSSSSYSHILAL